MAQAAPENGVVDPVGSQQREYVFNQAAVRGCEFSGRLSQPEFVLHTGLQRGRENGFVRLKCSQGQLLLADQGQQGLAQAKQVPVSDVGLLVECIAPGAVGVVADMAGVIGIKKLEWAVVDGQAQDAHVVGVHHTMTKTHRLPLRHHLRRTLTHRLQQGGKAVAAKLRAGAAGRVEPVYHMVGQGFQLGGLLAVGKVFKMPEADETWRHPCHHRSGFCGFAVHRCIRAGHAQRARGRNAQPMHGLAAQKLADARAQHGPAIAHARVGCQASALELDFLSSCGLPQQNGAPVSELAGPHAELVAAVDAGQRAAAGDVAVTAQGLQQRIRRQLVG